MRYDSFYPFQQQVTPFTQLPFSPQNFFPSRGINPFASFGQSPPQIPIPVSPTSKVDSFLQSADKLFSTAQSYTPYIKQAAPMVKNIPSLYRMYKGFQGLPDANSNTTNSNTKQREPRRPVDFGGRRQDPPPQRIDLTPKPSMPRIFQPPFEG